MADPRAMVSVANELFAAGSYAEALAAYDDALSVLPDAPEVECNRGAALRNLGRTDEALAALNKALELNGDFVEAHHNKGLTLQVAGQFDAAVASFRAAVALDPSFLQSHIGAAHALNQTGQHEDALEHFEKALELDAANAQIQTEKAFTLLRLGRADDALPVIEAAVAAAGDDASTRMKQTLAVTLATLGSANLQSGSHTEAVDLLTRAIDVEEQEGRVLNRAICYVQMDNFDGAKADLQRCLELNPSHRKAAMILASLHMNRSEWAEAASFFQLAAGMGDDAPDAQDMDASWFYNYGYVLLQQQLYDDAEAQFNRSLEVDPEFAASKSALTLVRTKRDAAPAAAPPADDAEAVAEPEPEPEPEPESEPEPEPAAAAAAAAAEPAPEPKPEAAAAPAAGAGAGARVDNTPAKVVATPPPRVVHDDSSDDDDESRYAGMGTVKKLALQMERKAAKHKRRQSLIAPPT